MSDNRKYYYLKLKENYFDEDAIVLLESMQDGILYSNILLKLYLKSLKNGGKLQLDENIPYTAQFPSPNGRCAPCASSTISAAPCRCAVAAIPWISDTIPS